MKKMITILGPTASGKTPVAARLAAEGGFDYFTTTLSISPLKDCERLNAIGMNWSYVRDAAWEKGLKHAEAYCAELASLDAEYAAAVAAAIVAATISTARAASIISYRFFGSRHAL